VKGETNQTGHYSCRHLCITDFPALIKKVASPFTTTIYKVISESSRNVIVVTASVKEEDRGGQDHTSGSLLQQSAM
jgi:hypothetical protein